MAVIVIDYRRRTELNWADILRQAHEGPEQSVISSAARWIGRRSVITVR
jgi:hypothetical protein